MATNAVDERKALLARTSAIKQELNVIGRHYVVNDSVLNSQTKRYNYLDTDVKLLRFAAGSMGTLSDAFILYAVAMLGVCDKASIQNFLLAFSSRNPSLYISDPNDLDALRARIKELVNNGFLFRNGYSFETNNKEGDSCLQEGVLYTIDEGALRFMCQKLGYRIVSNQWICAKPLEELIAWSASAYMISVMGLDTSFVEFKQGIFKSRELKMVMMTAELITAFGGNEYCVASIPAYLHQNRIRQTDKDFSRMRKDKIAIIRNYLLKRAEQDKDPYMVVACEDLADMEKMAQNIIEEGSLLEYTSRVYFVGEGAVRNSVRNVSDSMFRLVLNEDGSSYGLVLSKAPFLVGESITT